MSVVNTFACNVCQVQKKEANHWFQGHIVGSGVLIVPWSEPTANLEKADAHLCGIEHALQWAAKKLNESGEVTVGK